MTPTKIVPDMVGLFGWIDGLWKPSAVADGGTGEGAVSNAPSTNS